MLKLKKSISRIGKLPMNQRKRNFLQKIVTKDNILCFLSFKIIGLIDDSHIALESTLLKGVNMEKDD